MRVDSSRVGSQAEQRNHRGLGSSTTSRHAKRFDLQCNMFSITSFSFQSRNRNNSLDEYPLHLACQNGQIEVVGKLLQEFSPVTLEHDMNRWSPLHHAAW